MATGQIVLDRRIERLERIGRQQRGAVQQWDGYQFKVSPTCPPSTSITFRGGLCWLMSSVGEAEGWFVDSYTADLTDTDLVSTNTSFTDYSYTFANAYYYAGCVFVLKYGLHPSTFGSRPSSLPDQSIVLGGTKAGTADAFEEFATAAEAENALATMSVERANSAGLTMAALVLRNNGNTTDPNEFMEIDRVNRGRSYLLWDYRQAWEIA